MSPAIAACGEGRRLLTSSCPPCREDLRWRFPAHANKHVESDMPSSLTAILVHMFLASRLLGCTTTTARLTRGVPQGKDEDFQAVTPMKTTCTTTSCVNARPPETSTPPLHLQDNRRIHSERRALQIARDASCKSDLHLVANAVPDQNAFHINLLKAQREKETQRDNEGRMDGLRLTK